MFGFFDFLYRFNCRHGKGQFRKDLFYRLNVVPIHLPPLENRRDDIPIFSDFFMAAHANAMGRAPRNFSDDAITALQSHPWPGNLWELQKCHRTHFTFFHQQKSERLRIGR